MDEIVNKVAKSGLVTFDFEEHYPEGTRMSLDIKDQLWMGMALKEKDFRDFISSHDWSPAFAKAIPTLSHCELGVR